MSRVELTATPSPRRDEGGHLPFPPLPIRPARIRKDHNGIGGLSLAQRMHLCRGAEVLR
jgi:hypothetical protein